MDNGAIWEVEEEGEIDMATCNEKGVSFSWEGKKR